jgi:peptide/nickel transport system substrate-binding protein
LALVGAAIVVPAAGSNREAAPRGGTYRVGWEDISFDSLDPVGAYPEVNGILSNLLVRTLVGYDHVAGTAGTRLVPDLAERVPAPTNGGRTYTFTLRRGVRFGPPVNRAITSRDIRYALERLGRRHFGLQHGLYFEVVRGFDTYRRGRARSIAGIRTPNARTIAFDLTRPASEFPYALTLPAAAPAPREVAGCFASTSDGYNFDVVSSGPYMIDGADAVDASSCATLRPMRGVSRERLSLVRNPRYDPATDSRAARESNPDRFVFLAVVGRGGARNAVEIGRRLAAGELDDAILISSPKVLAAAIARARKAGRLRLTETEALQYVAMNVTQPPFDDVHVRRALSWAIDRAALRDAWGGSPAGPIPQHVFRDELLGGALRGYAPFRTPGGHGDVARAKAELKRSRYRTRYGVCVDPVCRHVALEPVQECTCYAAGQRMAPIVKAAGAAIGIRFDTRTRSFEKIFQPAENVPITPNGEWFVDYPDPSSVLQRHLSGRRIPPADNWNVSLVGITPAAAARLGVRGSVRRAPSIDSDVDRCGTQAGAARRRCFAALDRRLSTELVPWIPYLRRNRITILGAQVAKWAFDESTGMTSFAHVAVGR